MPNPFEDISEAAEFINEDITVADYLKIAAAATAAAAIGGTVAYKLSCWRAQRAADRYFKKVEADRAKHAE